MCPHAQDMMEDDLEVYFFRSSGSKVQSVTVKVTPTTTFKDLRREVIQVRKVQASHESLYCVGLRHGYASPKPEHQPQQLHSCKDRIPGLVDSVQETLREEHLLPYGGISIANPRQVKIVVSRWRVESSQKLMTGEDEDLTTFLPSKPGATLSSDGEQAIDQETMVPAFFVPEFADEMLLPQLSEADPSRASPESVANGKVEDILLKAVHERGIKCGLLQRRYNVDGLTSTNNRSTSEWKDAWFVLSENETGHELWHCSPLSQTNSDRCLSPHDLSTATAKVGPNHVIELEFSGKPPFCIKASDDKQVKEWMEVIKDRTKIRRTADKDVESWSRASISAGRSREKMAHWHNLCDAHADSFLMDIESQISATANEHSVREQKDIVKAAATIEGLLNDSVMRELFQTSLGVSPENYVFWTHAEHYVRLHKKMETADMPEERKFWRRLADRQGNSIYKDFIKEDAKYGISFHSDERTAIENVLKEHGKALPKDLFDTLQKNAFKEFSTTQYRSFCSEPAYRAMLRVLPHYSKRLPSGKPVLAPHLEVYEEGSKPLTGRSKSSLSVSGPRPASSTRSWFGTRANVSQSEKDFRTSTETSADASKRASANSISSTTPRKMARDLSIRPVPPAEHKEREVTLKIAELDITFDHKLTVIDVGANGIAAQRDWNLIRVNDMKVATSLDLELCVANLLKQKLVSAAFVFKCFPRTFSFDYQVRGDLGFTVNDDLSVIHIHDPPNQAFDAGVELGWTVTGINDMPVKSFKEFTNQLVSRVDSVSLAGASGVHASKINGTYRRQDLTHNGASLFRNSGDEDVWLFLVDGLWVVGDTVRKDLSASDKRILNGSEELEEKAGEDMGLIFLTSKHDDLMTSESTDGGDVHVGHWQVYVGGQDQMLSVEKSLISGMNEPLRLSFYVSTYNIWFLRHEGEGNDTLGLQFDDDLIVTGVQPSSPAEKNGVVTGWQLLAIDRSPLRSKMEAMKRLKETASRNDTLLLFDVFIPEDFMETLAKATDKPFAEAEYAPNEWWEGFVLQHDGYFLESAKASSPAEFRAVPLNGSSHLPLWCPGDDTLRLIQEQVYGLRLRKTSSFLSRSSTASALAQRLLSAESMDFHGEMQDDLRVSGYGSRDESVHIFDSRDLSLLDNSSMSANSSIQRNMPKRGLGDGAFIQKVVFHGWVKSAYTSNRSGMRVNSRASDDLSLPDDLKRSFSEQLQRRYAIVARTVRTSDSEPVGGKDLIYLVGPSMIDPASWSAQLVPLDNNTKIEPAPGRLNAVHLKDMDGHWRISPDACYDDEIHDQFLRWMSVLIEIFRGCDNVTEVLHEGFLQKRGKYNTAAKKRWFQLVKIPSNNEHVLRYFNPMGENGEVKDNIRGEIKNISDVTQDQNQKFTVTGDHFEAKGENGESNRTFYFTAESQEARDRWIKELKSIIGEERVTQVRPSSSNFVDRMKSAGSFMSNRFRSSSRTPPDRNNRAGSRA